MELPPMPERQGFDEDTKLRAPTLTKTREIIILYSIICKWALVPPTLWKDLRFYWFIKTYAGEIINGTQMCNNPVQWYNMFSQVKMYIATVIIIVKEYDEIKLEQLLLWKVRKQPK